MADMYAAVVNSEPTTLTGAVGATDTTLHISEPSVIPDAPNILVIGADTSSPETVMITAKTGTVLTVTRGFQGAARSWGAGTLIARNFTAYDHDTFIENINANTAHRTEALPHVTADGQFNYGFKVDSDGVLVFIYEERA